MSAPTGIGGDNMSKWDGKLRDEELRGGRDRASVVFTHPPLSPGHQCRNVAPPGQGAGVRRPPFSGLAWVVVWAIVVVAPQSE